MKRQAGIRNVSAANQLRSGIQSTYSCPPSSLVLLRPHSVTLKQTSEFQGDLLCVKTAVIFLLPRNPGRAGTGPLPDAVNSPDPKRGTREQVYGSACRQPARLNPPCTRPGRLGATLDDRSAAARMASRRRLLLLPFYLSTPAYLFSPSPHPHLQIPANRFPEMHTPLLVAAASDIRSRRLHPDQRAGPTRAGPGPPKRHRPVPRKKTIRTDLRRPALHIPGRACFGMPRFYGWNAAALHAKSTTTVSALHGTNLRSS
ncbi:PREDICTED: uncharacterized protein LOC109482134 [Branchiostoma belcheri]|uniref:Uncharacterized protein LOC109482134 n=1 Tax=Branchiostoma belcheri TaxID=7741 RepID=A0A6P4ZGP5_BRABE|nr:PREDICTED: uncharacterized protein LOC109482134 [Branchiostoma belcheri]